VFGTVVLRKSKQDQTSQVIISALQLARLRRLASLDAISEAPKDRKPALLSALALLVLVVSFEYFQQLDFSLGIFYVFPIIVAATVLRRWQVVLLAFACAWVRGQFFAQAVTLLEFWLRYAMATIAYCGVGLLVVEMSQNRRRALSAYARVKLEQEMRHHAEDQLRILAESSPAAILTLNRRSEVLAANRAAHEMLGYTYPHDLVGKSIEDHIPVLAGALRVSTGNRQIRTSASSWATRANGETFPVATWFSTYGDGEDLRLAGILVDSSEEVRERERDNFRHILDYNRLLAGAVSHEIRNMCSAIRVVTSNLGKKQGMPGDADFSALTSLVTSLSKIASFDLDQSKQQDSGWLSLNDLLGHLRVVIEPDWSDVGGEITWNIQVPSPSVHADAHALLQIFLNLSQNSLRAAQDCVDPRLEIATWADGPNVVISFADNGPGIADPSVLFQPFRPEANGSGLGLFISRTLARSFSGQLNHVPVRQGCRFELVLRRQEAVKEV